MKVWILSSHPDDVQHDDDVESIIISAHSTLELAKARADEIVAHDVRMHNDSVLQDNGGECAVEDGWIEEAPELDWAYHNQPTDTGGEWLATMPITIGDDFHFGVVALEVDAG